MTDSDKARRAQPSAKAIEDHLYMLIEADYRSCTPETDPEIREYLQSRLGRNSLRRTVDAYLYYAHYLPTEGNLLDWGSGMGAESCMMRQTLGDAVNLHGCDLSIGKWDAATALTNYSRMKYSQITHPYKVPYEDNFFDAVVGSGVLEHVQFDNESLRELHRILKPGGILVISFLPNRYSYTESVARKLKRGGHQHTYTHSLFDDQLRHNGFAPIEARYHQFVPASTNPTVSPIYEQTTRNLWFLNGFLERTWPTRLFCANLMVVSRSVQGFY